jgi:hypothetical protein
MVCNKKYPFVIFSGYIVEDFNEEIHKTFTTDYSDMQQVTAPITNLEKVLLRSDGNVYWGPNDAAKSFSDFTESTADWISKCCKNNKPAMGYNWKFLTRDEVVAHILTIIRNKGNNSVK